MSAYTRAKCAKAECTKRSQERNKALITVPQGTFIAYLCDQCFREYQEALKGEVIQ